jgi:hypothetical protein
MNAPGDGLKGREVGEAHRWQRILDRSWLLPSAVAKTIKVVGREGKLQGSCFHMIWDDLLHPIMCGNKLWKLDALIPLLQAHGVMDVVRLQSNPVLFIVQLSQTYPNHCGISALQQRWGYAIYVKHLPTWNEELANLLHTEKYNNHATTIWTTFNYKILRIASRSLKYT